MDFVTDQSGRQLLRLENLIAVPPYVKESSVTAEAMADLGDHVFADPVRREFPCDSPAHTYLSHAYCGLTGSGSQVVQDRIKAAAERHGITEDLHALDLVFEGLEKQAHTENQPVFAIQIDFGPGDPGSENVHVKQGGVRGFYPINDDFQIRASAGQMAENRHRIPLELFAEGCQALVKAAYAHGLKRHELPKTILMYGEDRLPNHEYVEHEADRRAKLTGDSFYRDLAKSAAVNSDNRPMSDYIDLWLQADGLNSVRHGRSVPDPFLIFNSGPVKAAVDAELNRWTLIDEVAVPVAALAAIDQAQAEKYFAKEAAVRVVALCKKAATTHDLAADIATLNPATRKSLLKLLAA